MSRRSKILATEEESQVDLTPMLDVAFILLIFFIVTANFIKDPGLEVSRPESETAQVVDSGGILVAISLNGEVFMDGRQIHASQVKANVLRLRAELPDDAGAVIRADAGAEAEIIVKVMDGIRAAGIRSISLGTDQE